MKIPESVFESLSEGVLILDARGHVINGNLRAEEILGLRIDDIRHRGFEDTDWVFVGEDGSPLDASENPIMIALLEGRACPRIVIGIDAPHLARRWVTVSTTPLALDDDLRGTIALFDDVTDRIHTDTHLRLLLEVSRCLTAVDDEGTFLQSLCDTLVEIGGYAIARVDAAVDDEERSVTTLFASGHPAGHADGRVRWGEGDATGRGPLGTALRTGETRVSNDAATDPDFTPWRYLVDELGVGSLAAVPFDLGDRRVALVVYGHHAQAFDDTVVRGLEEIAKEAQFGAAYVHSRRSLEAALDGTILALSRMTETRDPYTAGHQNRVGSLGEEIARRLGLDQETRDVIRQSGSLHDVGKIAIPAEILTRPGRLTELEFAMVKRHTVVGADILTQASLPWPIAEVALHHHERLDGSGYPDGLRGNEISLPSRIIAVADVVEAMTQHRPYRPGMGLDLALAEVRDNAGRLYDADAVAACVAAFAEGYTFATVRPAPLLD